MRNIRSEYKKSVNTEIEYFRKTRRCTLQVKVYGHVWTSGTLAIRQRNDPGIAAIYVTYNNAI